MTAQPWKSHQLPAPRSDVASLSTVSHSLNSDPKIQTTHYKVILTFIWTGLIPDETMDGLEEMNSGEAPLHSPASTEASERARSGQCST